MFQITNQCIYASFFFDFHRCTFTVKTYVVYRDINSLIESFGHTHTYYGILYSIPLYDIILHHILSLSLSPSPSQEIYHTNSY